MQVKYRVVIVCDHVDRRDRYCTESVVCEAPANASSVETFITGATKKFEERGWKMGKKILCPTHNRATN